MAMPPGNVVISDKMQFPNGGSTGGGGVGGGGGGEIHRGQWFPDERDGYILWLKSEFAAANAIIDSLCHHLRVIGEAGEYEAVIGSVQQRRGNWNPVLHMQQYFSVAEVACALQQVAWRRQQRCFDPAKAGLKEYRRSGSGFKHAQRGETHVKEARDSVPEYCGSNGDSSSERRDGTKSGEEDGKSDDEVEAVTEEKREVVAKSPADDGLTSLGCSVVATCGNSELKEKDAHSIQNHSKEQDHAPIPKTFVGNEMFEGKAVNVVEGLKLHEELLEEKEVSTLVSLANDLRAAGRKGQLQGQAYVSSKRPMRGHGREMIQLGLQIADSPPEDEQDSKMESIPSLLQDVVERLVTMRVMTVKPDSCIIDFYNENDHSQPNMWPYWFGRPISMLFLTECDMTFGKNIGSNHPGDHRGPLKLSLSPGSLLVMQGNSADLAKHAIPAIRKQRILVTFTKSQPKKFLPGERLPSPAAATSPPHWSRTRHPASQKHYATAPTPPAPPVHPHIIPSPNGLQPLLIAAPVPIPTGWPPRPPVPGTGVFLRPPGSGKNSPSPQQLLSNGSGVPNHANSSPIEGKVRKQESTGAPEKGGSIFF